MNRKNQLYIIPIFLVTSLLLCLTIQAQSEHPEHHFEVSSVDLISTVDLNGPSDYLDIEPGGTILVSLDYVVWARDGCPGCILQIVVGLDEQPLYCAYNGGPGRYPGVNGSDIHTITAPKKPGTYHLMWIDAREYSCEDAKHLYQERPSERKKISTIEVSSEISFISGYVYDLRTDDPIENMEFELYESDKSLVGTTRSDSNGYFYLGKAKSNTDYCVYGTCAGYASKVYCFITNDNGGYDIGCIRVPRKMVRTDLLNGTVEFVESQNIYYNATYPFFGPNAWHDLAVARGMIGILDTLIDLCKGVSQLYVMGILGVPIDPTHSMDLAIGVYQISQAQEEAWEIQNFNDIASVIYLEPDIDGWCVHEELRNLIINGEDISEAYANGDNHQVVNLLENRAKLIEDTYLHLTAFDYYMGNNFGDIEVQDRYNVYYSTRTMIAGLTQLLEIDYIVTTCCLNNVTFGLNKYSTLEECPGSFEPHMFYKDDGYICTGVLFPHDRKHQYEFTTNTSEPIVITLDQPVDIKFEETDQEEHYLMEISGDCAVYGVELKGVDCSLDVSITSPNNGDTFGVGDGINFESSVSGGEVVSYLWSFGDGATGTSRTQTHSYLYPGIYGVTLIAVDSNEVKHIDSVSISIS